MSTPAAIAAVTAVLKDLLENGLIEQGATTATGPVTVTALPPDRISLPETTTQLNLFLYLVTPNTGWSNTDLPTRDANGDLLNAPALALDLHYLVSAYAVKDFQAEVLLGYAMQLLHETPVLARDAIRLAMRPSGAVNGTGLPAGLQDLAASGLADQVELIKIAPKYLSTDEMFKLWMAFQAPYRPTAGYLVTVVLIESARKGRSAPPVRSRAVYAVPFRRPAVEDILSQAPAPPNAPFSSDQPILSGYRLALAGAQLKGGATSVLLDGAELPPAQVQVADNRIIFPLPTSLAAGAHSVQVIQPLAMGVPPAPHRGVESAPAFFQLHPTVTGNVTADVTDGQGASDSTPRAGSVTVPVAPAVGAAQQVTLLLNEFAPPAGRPPRAYRFTLPPNQPGLVYPLNLVTIDFDGVLPATYLVRVQVDGAESPLARVAGVYHDPQVTIS
jgi:hypothetical protein